MPKPRWWLVLLLLLTALIVVLVEASRGSIAWT